MKTALGCLIAACLLGYNLSAAQTISSDRPDFADDVNTVPVGLLQFESGYSYAHTPGEKQNILGELMLRTGLCRHSELRLGFGSYLHDGASGWGDGSLDLRLSLLRPEQPDRPGAFSLTALAGTSLPIGSHALSAHRLQPSLMLTSALTLSARVALAPCVNYSLQNSPAGQYSQFSAGGSFILTLTDRLSWYMEGFATTREGGFGGDTGYAGGGFLWLVRDNLQLDVHGLSVLNGRSPDYSFGVGLSFYSSIK